MDGTKELSMNIPTPQPGVTFYCPHKTWAFCTFTSRKSHNSCFHLWSVVYGWWLKEYTNLTEEKVILTLTKIYPVD